MPLIAPDHIEVGTGRLLSIRSAREQGAISGKFLVDSSDVIYSKIRPYLMKVHRAKFSALCSADMYALKPREGVDGRYLANVLLGSRFTNYAVGESMRSGIPKVNRDALAGYEFPVPSGSEQSEIGEVLDSTDELLLSLERLIEKKREIKQGVLQELLSGRTRLPGFAGEWVECELSSLIDGLVAGTSVRSVSGMPRPGVLKTSAVRDGRVHEAEVKRILPEDVHRARCMPVANSILISRMNTPAMVGEVGYVERDLPGVYLPDRLWLARPRRGSGTNMRWLAACLSFGATAELVRGLATGTSGSMKNIAKSGLLALRLNVPSVAEQSAIGSLIVDLDSEIAALEKRLESARAINVGMAQELLTGRTRLPVKEDA